MLDTITFILALIGSIGTAYTVIMTFYWHRISIDVSITDHAIAKDTVVLYMVFTNNSRLPISITDVKIWNRCIPYSCVKEPTTVRVDTRTTGKTIVYREAIKSLPFPVTLPCLSGTSGFLYFQIPQENFECASNSLTVELNTNRHWTLRKTLSLSEN
ncbi:MAG: hypothetical protein ACLUP9_10795 [Waltera sp.]|jgi:hypothetical protein|uniref:hypothetical protein n=1 Tax=Waltera sp. TaxID=2815806 RepID=UPI0039968150